MGIIYLITHRESGKKYVGQTIRPLSERLAKHRHSPGCPYLYNALTKFGMDAFEVRELGWANDRDVLDILETQFIEQYQTAYPEGYNLRTTGKGVYHHATTKEKISAKAKAQFLSSAAREQASLLRGSQPFTVYCRETGQPLWNGVNKTACAQQLGINRSSLRNMLNSPTRSAKGCVAKYDADTRPVLLAADLALYRQEFCTAAANGYPCPTWQEVFQRIA